MDFGSSINARDPGVYQYRVQKLKDSIAGSLTDSSPKFALVRLNSRTGDKQTVVNALVEGVNCVREALTADQRTSLRKITEKVNKILARYQPNDTDFGITAVPNRQVTDERDADSFFGDFTKVIDFVEETQCNFPEDVEAKDLRKLLFKVVSFIQVAQWCKPIEAVHFNPQFHSSAVQYSNIEHASNATIPAQIVVDAQSTNLTRSTGDLSETSRAKQDFFFSVVESFREQVGADATLAPKVSVVNFHRLSPDDCVKIGERLENCLSTLAGAGINTHTHSVEHRWACAELLSPLLFPALNFSDGDCDLQIVDFPTGDIPETYTLVIDLIRLRNVVAAIQESDHSDRFYSDVAGLLAVILHLFVFLAKQEAYLGIAYQVGRNDRKELLEEEKEFYRYTNSFSVRQVFQEHEYDIPEHNSQVTDHIYNSLEQISIPSSLQSGSWVDPQSPSRERLLDHSLSSSHQSQNTMPNTNQGNTNRPHRTNPFVQGGMDPGFGQYQGYTGQGNTSRSQDVRSYFPGQPTFGQGYQHPGPSNFGQGYQHPGPFNFGQGYQHPGPFNGGQGYQHPPPGFQWQGPSQGAWRGNQSGFQARSHLKIPIPKYSNKQCAKKFMDKFEHRMEANKVDPNIRVAHLEDSVLGTEAEDWLDRYLYFNSRDCDWEVLKGAFIRHFADAFARDTAFYKMEARVMSEDEPVKAYVDSKLALLVRYDPDMKVQDQILHIENGLIPKYKEMLFNFTYDDLEALTQHLTRAEGKINRHLRTVSKAKETNQMAPKVQIQETSVAAMVTKEEFANFQATMINAFQQLSFANGRGDKKKRPPTPYRSDRSSSRSTAASGRSTDREDGDKKYKSKQYSHKKGKSYSKHKSGHQSKKESHYKDKKYSKSKSSHKHSETSGEESGGSHNSHHSSRDPTPDNKKKDNHSKSKNGKK